MIQPNASPHRISDRRQLDGVTWRAAMLLWLAMMFFAMMTSLAFAFAFAFAMMLAVVFGVFLLSVFFASMLVAACGVVPSLQPWHMFCAGLLQIVVTQPLL